MSDIFLDGRKIPKVKVKFRIKLSNVSNNQLLSYYMPKWYKLITHISHLNKTRDKFIEMPEMRKVIKSDIKLSQITPLLDKIQSQTRKLLLDIAPLFDTASLDLRVYILCMIGITSSEYNNFITENFPEYSFKSLSNS